MVASPDPSCNATRLRAAFRILGRQGRWFLSCLCLALLPVAVAADLAVFEWSKKDTALANQYLALLAADPSSDAALDLLWKLYQDHGSTDLLLKSVKKQADTQSDRLGYLILARLYQKSGAIEEATALLDTILKEEPDHPLALRLRLSLARETGENALRRDLLQKMLEKQGDDPALLQELGQVEADADHITEALAWWEKAASSPRATPEILRSLVQSMAALGRLPEAAALLQRSVPSFPVENRPGLWEEISRLWSLADDFPSARGALEAAMALLHPREPRHEALFRQLFLLHEKFGQLKDWEKSLAQKAQQAPADETNWIYLERFHAMDANATGRAKALSHLVSLLPDDTALRLELARVYLETGRAGEVAEQLEVLKKSISHNHLPLLLLEADWLLRSGRKNDASALLSPISNAPTTEAGSRQAILQFALAHFLDDLALAIQEKDAEMNPFDEVAQTNLAGFLLERKRPDEAISGLQKWCDSSAEKAERDKRVIACVDFLVKRRQWDLAKHWIEAEQSNGNPPSALAGLLADVWQQLGEPEKAFKVLESIAASTEVPPAEKRDADERMEAILAGGKDPQSLFDPNDPFLQTKPAPKAPPPFNGFGTNTDRDQFLATQREISPAVLDYARDQAALCGVILADDESLPPIADPVFDQTTVTRDARLRAVWWLMRCDRMEAARLVLEPLTNDAQGARQRTDLEVERLLATVLPGSSKEAEITAQLQWLKENDKGNDAPRDWNLQLAAWLSRTGSEEEAETLLRQAIRDNPESQPSLELLARILIGQGRGQDAVALWKQRFDAASATEAALLIEPYTALLLDQGQFSQAMEAYVRIIKEERDLSRRREFLNRQLALLPTEADPLLQDDTATAQRKVDRRATLESLLATYEALTRKNPGDFFYAEAMARCHDLAGDAGQAFVFMKKAYYQAGEQGGNVTTLRDAALKAGDHEAAIQFQRRILRDGAIKSSPAEWLRLLALLEGDFLVAEAEKIRSELIGRFGRNPEILRQFIQNADQQERTAESISLRKILVDLLPWDQPAQLELVYRARLAGDNDALSLAYRLMNATEARAATPQARLQLILPLSDQRTATPSSLFVADEVLASSDGKPSSEFFAVAVTEGSRSRTELAIAPEAPVPLRLRTIEETARLLASDSSEKNRTDWLQRWQPADSTGSLSERLWGLFYAGARMEAGQVMLENGPVPQETADFLAQAIFHARCGTLPFWINRQREVNAAREAVVHEASRFALWLLVEEQPERLGQDMMKRLADSQVLPARDQWEMAVRLGETGHPELALALGQIILEGPAGGGRMAPVYARSMRRWAEASENWQEARRLGLIALSEPSLLNLSDLGTQLNSLDLLSSTPEHRDEIHRQIRANLPSPGNAMTIQWKAILAYREGNKETAIRFLEESWMERFPREIQTGNDPFATAGSLTLPQHERYWNNIRLAAHDLVKLGMHDLVEPVLKKALARDPLHVAGQDTGDDYRRVHGLLVAIQLPGLSPNARLDLVDSWRGRIDTNPGAMLQFADDLALFGFHREAALGVLRYLPSRAQTNSDYCSKLLENCLASGESELGIAYLDSVFALDPILQPQGVPAPLLHHYTAAFLAYSGDVDRLREKAFATGIPEAGVGQRPIDDTPYALQLAHRYGQEGDWAKAEPVLARLHALHRGEEAEYFLLAHARALIRLGQKERATLLLSSLSHLPETMPERVLVAWEAGIPLDFRRLLANAVGTNQFLPLCLVLEKAGERNLAMDALETAARANLPTAPRAACRLEKLKLLLAGPFDVDALDRELGLLAGEESAALFSSHLTDLESAWSSVAPKQQQKALPVIRQHATKSTSFNLAAWFLFLKTSGASASEAVSGLPPLQALTLANLQRQLGHAEAALGTIEQAARPFGKHQSRLLAMRSRILFSHHLAKPGWQGELHRLCLAGAIGPFDWMWEQDDDIDATMALSYAELIKTTLAMPPAQWKEKLAGHILRSSEATDRRERWLTREIASFVPPLETREPWRALLGPDLPGEGPTESDTYWLRDLANYLRQSHSPESDPLAGFTTNPALRMSLIPLLTNPQAPVIVPLAPAIPQSEP